MSNKQDIVPIFLKNEPISNKHSKTQTKSTVTFKSLKNHQIIVYTMFGILKSYGFLF